MLMTLATIAALGIAQQTDTTIPVRAGARLEVSNFGGEIAVKTWSKSAVRVQATHSGRDRISIDATDQYVRVKSEGRRGPSQLVDYDITVPASMSLTLSGVYTDISVEGSQGEVTVETVEGSVKVSGGAGNVSLKSVQGEVTLENARGRISLNSVNEMPLVTQNIGLRLRHQYMLAYQPQAMVRDGRWHKISVKLRLPKKFPFLHVEARAGYYSGGE